MIKTLQKKFIATAMAAISILLLVLTGTINVANGLISARQTDEQLKSELRFHVQEAEAGTGWDVVTDHCCLGGCDMNVRAFRTERDALLFARLLKAVDYRPSHNIACPACYEEHMKGRNCL